MINLEEFFKVFENSGFTQKDLKRFYKSIKRSFILVNAGERAMPLLLKEEEECQWPILRKIDDKALDIYKGVAKGSPLLNQFVNSIKDEKQLRSSASEAKEENVEFLKKKFNTQSLWLILRILIHARAELYKVIFDFNDDDIKRCRRVGERLEKILLLKWQQEKNKI